MKINGTINDDVIKFCKYTNVFAKYSQENQIQTIYFKLTDQFFVLYEILASISTMSKLPP